jgi:hypothetical protein
MLLFTTVGRSYYCLQLWEGHIIIYNWTKVLLFKMEEGYMVDYNYEVTSLFTKGGRPYCCSQRRFTTVDLNTKNRINLCLSIPQGTVY